MGFKEKMKGIVARFTVLLAVTVGFLTVNAVDVKAEADYLTFTAQEADATITVAYSSCDGWEYRLNDGAWETGYSYQTITLPAVGDKVQLRANNMKTDYANHFSISKKIAASGSVTSLTDNSGDDAEVQLDSNCYNSMFRECTNLTKAPKLPSKKLADFCYTDMFNGCTGLTEAPELPATILLEHCYQNMFYNCTGLTEAPELEATTLADYCYYKMFSGCTGLTEAPELLADTLANCCYYNMFYNCTGLTEAPKLEATTLAESCYYGMFSNCIGLTSTPDLRATTLANGCYGEMFSGCTGLTSVPDLGATTLAMYCYDSMFKNCTGLEMWYEETDVFTKPWKIPAEVNPSATGSMFKGCPNVYLGPDAFWGTPEVNRVYYLKVPRPTPTPTPQKKASGDGKKDKKKETKYIDLDTNKSEVPYGTVLLLNSEDKSVLQDMKVHPVDTKTKSNQEFLVQDYAKKLGKKARIILTKSIHPRNQLVKDKHGIKKILKWENLEKKAQTIYAVCYNETDKAYYLTGTLDANGTAVFNDFITNNATNITLFVLE